VHCAFFTVLFIDLYWVEGSVICLCVITVIITLNYETKNKAFLMS